MFPMSFGGADLDELLRRMQQPGEAKGPGAGLLPDDGSKIGEIRDAGLKGLPPAGPYAPGVSKGDPYSATITGGIAGAQAQPFTPGFMSTSPFDASPRWVGSPEERALALASQATTQARHDTIGMANLAPTRDQLAAFDSLSGQLNGSVRSAGHDAFQGQEGMLNRENQLLLKDKGVLGDMDVERMRGANLLETSKQHGRDAAEAARIKAAGDHGLSLNQATINLLGGMAANPNADPKAFGVALDYLKSLRGQGPGLPPAAGPAGDPNLIPPKDAAPGVPAAAATPPAAAAPAPAADPLQKMVEVNQANQANQQLGGEFGTVGPNGFQQAPDLGIDHATKFLDRVAAGQMTPEQVAKLAGDIKAGKFGDPQKVTAALAKTTAQGYFKLQPPTGPDGKPIDFGRAMLATTPGGVSQKVPGSYQIPGLFDMTAAPESFPSRMGNVATMQGPRAGGVPYNQLKLGNGQVVPISPSDLNSVVGNALGPKVDPAQRQNRTAYGDMLLRALYGK